MTKLGGTDDYLSLARAAELSGRKVETLRVQALRGGLRTIKTGREHFTTRRWLHEYLLQHGETRPVPPDYRPPR